MDKSLGKWLSHQRTAHNDNGLSEEQMEKLLVIGFQFSINCTTTWEQRHDELQADELAQA